MRALVPGYKLSSRDLVEMMYERGLHLAHTTILRWVQRYAPEFIKRWNRFGRPAGRFWRVDETYVKVRGQWTAVLNGRGTRIAIFDGVVLCFVEVWRYLSRFWMDFARFAQVLRMLDAARARMQTIRWRI